MRTMRRANSTTAPASSNLRECLTYAIGGGAMRDLAAMANIELGGAPPA